MAQMSRAIFDFDTEFSAERRLYEALARELGEAWAVFYHMKWIGHDDLERPHDGEAEFVVAHPHWVTWSSRSWADAFGSTRPPATSSALTAVA
jgi:hypothetical protein